MKKFYLKIKKKGETDFIDIFCLVRYIQSIISTHR